MRSISSERPLDPAAVAILRAVHGITDGCGIRYLVVGATARDILLTHVHGLPATRATKNVDFAVAVETWAEFGEIGAALVQHAGFRAATDAPHRFYYVHANARSYPLDLVPFGGVAGADLKLRWPPDMTVLMNVAGYAEAAASAERVKIADDLIVNVASLPGLALFKLLAWHDRAPGNTKDADDLLTLMRNYSEAGNIDRVFELDEDVFAALGYDPDAAGVLLLGADIAKLAKRATLAQCQAILNDPILIVRLAMHMARTRPNVEEGKALADRLLGILVKSLRE
ncbi:nucleotidyl transferase AbiEii/AbiGii toxin family protein [Cupriavidus necator]|uniref:nucleotidyl transferase AbiEii/AbiGii toxin family protein n=1 Tax=Cupriavidus necator TaxID=106590 RepID=UPI0012D2E181|nr:nucleotidyl transferase AbiEii/AbiGii toxin family protein [Cupriavidus necator]